MRINVRNINILSRMACLFGGNTITVVVFRCRLWYALVGEYRQWEQWMMPSRRLEFSGIMIYNFESIFIYYYFHPVSFIYHHHFIIGRKAAECMYACMNEFYLWAFSFCLFPGRHRPPPHPSDTITPLSYHHASSSTSTFPRRIITIGRRHITSPNPPPGQ